MDQPRLERGFDDCGRGGVAAGCGGARSAVEDNIGSVVVERRGHDMIINFAGY